MAKVVSVELQAKVDGFVGGMRKAKGAVDDVTKAAAPSKAQAFKGFADKAALAGLGIATAVGVAVKRFADFDQAMSAVQANSGATGASLDALRAQAIKMGADSQFSATEAAQGINEMSKAGVQASDILGGGLKGALDLAAAGQISVADAAETAATAMTVFGLSGDKVPHVADLLAAAASKAQGGVGDMSNALKYAGSTAASMGISIEETTGTLAYFASQGIIGEQAGTSFRSMLLSLTAPSTVAKKAMEDLNLNVYDGQNNFIGMAGAADEMKRVLGPLDEKTRTAALGQIFGNESIGAAIKLYEGGGAAVTKWTGNVDDAGFAAKQAAALTDNLKGDIERLGGALDSVLIQTGGSANGSLRTLTQGLTDFVGYVGGLPGPLLLAGGALSAFALLAPKGVLAYRSYKAQLDTLGLSFDRISARAPRTGAALEKAAGGAKKAGVALLAAGTAAAAADAAFGKDGSGVGVQSLTKDLLAGGDAVKVFSGRVQKYAEGQSNWFNTDQVRSYGDVLKAAFDPSVGQGIDKVAGSLVGISTDVSNANQRLGELDQVLTGLVSGGQQDKANELFDQFAAAAKASGISVEQLQSKLPGYSEALAGVANTSAAASAGQGDLAASTGTVETAAEDAKKALDDYVDRLQNAGLIVLGTREANRGFQQALDDATASIKDNGKSLDITTEKGRANQSALDDVANSALDLAKAVYEQTGSETAMRASLLQSRSSLVETGIKFGLTKKQAGAYADAILKIPPAVKTSAQFDSKKAETAFQSYINRLRGNVVNVGVRYVDLGKNPTSKAGGITKADGGPIYGPGTKTSDDVPIWASRGEFMQKAAAVDKYGERFMHAVNNLQFPAHLARGFAGGGPVQYAPRGGVAASSPSRATTMGVRDVRQENTYVGITDPARLAALTRADLAWTVSKP